MPGEFFKYLTDISTGKQSVNMILDFRYLLLVWMHYYRIHAGYYGVDVIISVPKCEQKILCMAGHAR